MVKRQMEEDDDDCGAAPACVTSLCENSSHGLRTVRVERNHRSDQDNGLKLRLTQLFTLKSARVQTLRMQNRRQIIWI